MLSIPDNHSSSKLADWVELQLLTSDKRISKAALKQRVQLALGTVEESLIDETLLELGRRASLYGPNVLFTVDANIVRRTKVRVDWRNYPEYAMCLIYSILGVEYPADGGPKLFERLSAVALGKYLGGNTMIMGHPSGLGFEDQVFNLARQCNEEIGFDPYSAAQDEGVDVVGWIPFGDGRSSQVFVLLQCAAGKHGHKKSGIRQDIWRDLIRWNNRTIPGMSMPRTIGASEWFRMTQVFDLIFDRPRLFGLITSMRVHDAALRTEIVDWCELQLA